MLRTLFPRTTCRHPSSCPTTTGPDDLMCTVHAADESLAFNRDNRLAPWDLRRRDPRRNRRLRNG